MKLKNYYLLILIKEIENNSLTVWTKENKILGYKQGIN
jgi:hypothetical protein